MTDARPMPTPEPGRLVAEVVGRFAFWNRGQEERGGAGLSLARPPQTEVIQNFILRNLVAPESEWQRLREEDPERFEAEVKMIPLLLNEYLAQVAQTRPVDQVAEEELQRMKPDHLRGLEAKWGCDMYLLRIC